MDAQTKIIVDTVNEFLESAKEDENNGRLRSAITMYFKALVEMCDYLIYRQILKVPFNHTNRFELLEKYYPEIYVKVSPLFKVYRKTYSQSISLQDLEVIKNVTIETINKSKVIEIM